MQTHHSEIDVGDLLAVGSSTLGTLRLSLVVGKYSVYFITIFDGKMTYNVYTSVGGCYTTHRLISKAQGV